MHYCRKCYTIVKPNLSFMKSNYVPLEDRVVVTVPEKTEQKTSSGLIIPVGTDKSILREVVVKAVGDGVKSNGQNIKMFLKPGQKVIIGRNTGVEYEMDGEMYRIIRQDDVQFLASE